MSVRKFLDWTQRTRKNPPLKWEWFSPRLLEKETLSKLQQPLLPAHWPQLQCDPLPWLSSSDGCTLELQAKISSSFLKLLSLDVLPQQQGQWWIQYLTKIHPQCSFLLLQSQTIGVLSLPHHKRKYDIGACLRELDSCLQRLPPTSDLGQHSVFIPTSHFVSQRPELHSTFLLLRRAEVQSICPATFITATLPPRGKAGETCTPGLFSDV